ncbi:hypothetical protein Barb6_03195 [Bacteroidales bacterium Barb6]|nr:hypothetical protein Barb6_03195 [Bacteroidales bacterium Barb6]
MIYTFWRPFRAFLTVSSVTPHSSIFSHIPPHFATLHVGLKSLAPAGHLLTSAN